MIKELTKQEILSKQRVLLRSNSKLRFSDKIKPKDIAEIIYLLFKYDNGKYYDFKNYFKGKEFTYSVKTNRKSGNYRSRSMEDTFRLTRYYISKIKYQDIYNIFRQLTDLISGDYCYICRRYVYGTRGLFTLENIRASISKLNIKIKYK